MKKWWILGLLLASQVHAQTTPNIGLNIPAFGTQSWNVLLNNNFNRLDLLLSGNQTIPGLSISGNLSVTGTITGNTNTITTSGSLGLTITSLGGGVGKGSLTLSTAGNGGSFITDNNGDALILGSSITHPANINLSNTGITSGFVNTSSATTFVYGNPIFIGVNPNGGTIGATANGFTISSTSILIAGLLQTAGSTTVSAGFNLTPGSQPTSPNNGDMWMTVAGVFAQVNGSTVGPFSTSGGTGLSGMTPGQVPIAATATTVISSKALAGAGASITTGPNIASTGHLTSFTGTAGQIQDSGLISANVVLAVSPGAGVAHFAGSTQTLTSSLVSLTADVTGNLPVANLNSGTGATSSTFWRGDGTWASAGGGSGTWNGNTNPTGALNLTMGSNVSTFNTTTNLSQFFSWKNTTAAIVGTSQGSPVLAICGRAFHGSADVEDCFTLSELPGNGNDAAITINIGHTGTSTGVVTLQAPGPIAAGINGTGSLVIPGGTSGQGTITVQSTAGTPTVTLGTNSGTPAVTATAPLVITSATGNIACATCVVASSPGVGLAHFAGSTQTVTSSLVVIADLGATGTPSSSTFLRGDNTWSTPGGSGTVTVVGAGSLTSTALVTGGGTTTLQTPSATSTLDASGNLSLAAAGSLKSADTGTPGFTFAANKITANAAMTHALTSNQEIFGTTTNLTTVSYPASSGAVTVTMPNTTTLVLGGNSDTTTTDICHASATAGICNFTALVIGDIPTISIAKGGTNATSAAAGQVPNATSGSASSWTSTITLGASGTLGSVAMGNATSGTVTIQPIAGALGAVTASLPANTGTIGELNLAQTWTALQTFGAQASIGATAHGVLLSENTSAAVASAAGTAGQFFRSGGSGADGAYTDFPEHLIIPAANCNSATAGAGWSIPASNAPTVACRAGTNNLGGVLQWANNNTTTNAQFEVQLPFDWDTATQPYINIIYGSGANTSGTIKWTFATACTKSDGSITDDPAFNAESATSGKTMAVANRMWAESVQFTAVTSGNNCIAGSRMVVKVTSGNGTATSTVNVAQVTMTVPRLLTVQAN